MKIACLPALVSVLMLSGCASEKPLADPDLAAEIDRIPAIDNHAHPVRVVGAGEQPDRFFDALPVDNMEAQSDPLNLRSGSAAAAEASRALYGSGGRGAKAEVMRQKGDQYPA